MKDKRTKRKLGLRRLLNDVYDVDIEVESK